MAGRANVLIFPISTPATSPTSWFSISRGHTVGPVLQGFAHPVCDLSRGASVDDIVATACLALAMA